MLSRRSARQVRRTRRQARTFQVEALESRWLMATFTVINTNDSGAGSFRQAIRDADAAAGADTIAFNIPGTGPFTIRPTSALEYIDDQIFIDGYTQTGARMNTQAVGNDAVLQIVLDGSAAGPNVDGLTIVAGGSTVRGLVINKFQRRGLWLTRDRILIAGNFIGTDSAGIAARPNVGVGVRIQGSSNTIGGTTPADRNVISGNGSGVDIPVVSGVFENNLISGNYIGTNADGTEAVPNSTGVRISKTARTTIGGTTPGAGNVISGNKGAGIYIDAGASEHLIAGNFIGTNAAGTESLGNVHAGVFLLGTGSSTIGGTTAGARNVISGTRFVASGTSYAIGIVISNSVGNLVAGNFIGTNAAGSTALGNADNGVYIDHANDNTIGGTTPGAGNVVSGNLGDGVELISSSSRNLIAGNSIGTDITGLAALGNSALGVRVYDVYSNTVGGTVAGAGNTIAFNGLSGVEVGYGRRNTIAGNSIFANSGLGIDIGYNSGPTPNDPGDPDTGPNDFQNTPSLTGATSIGGIATIRGSLNSTPNSTFRTEFFSSDAADPSGFGEGQTFLASLSVTTDSAGNVPFSIDLPAEVPLGQVITATATEESSGNTSEFSRGIVLVSGFIVTNASDGGPGSLRQEILNANASAGRDTITFAIPGAGPHAIQLASPLPTITDPLIIDGYTQSGARQNAQATGGDADLRIVLDGGAAGPGAQGLTIAAGGSTVRGLVIQRFAGSGIVLSGGAGNLITGNFIGTDVAGTLARANSNGVFITNSSGNTIGGTTTGARNVISGNADVGVEVTGAGATGNLIAGNSIGINSSGTATLSNARDGVSITDASGNTIGGTTVGSRNLISGNLGAGVAVTGAGAAGNLIAGNSIGTDAAGLAALGNVLDGVRINSTTGTTVGGTVAGASNTIAFNGRTGVAVDSGVRNAILGNAIFTNLGLGIDLASDGPTSNDPGDMDPGPNDLQNFPVLTAATSSDGATTIQGTLDSTPNTTFRIEFFVSDGTDPTGPGEGRTFLGAVNVTTGSAGHGSFSTSLPVTVAAGQVIIATATSGGTSEFSRGVVVNGAFIVNNTSDGGVGSLRQAILNANTSTGLGSIAFAIPGPGPFVIRPASALPTITDPVIIDGYTQAGARTNTRVAGSDAILQIVLDGGAAGLGVGGVNGLTIAGDGGSTVRGLVIHQFSGAGIALLGSNNNLIAGNLIGTNTGGTAALPNTKDGVVISFASGNTIGGTTPGARNVISGNAGNGVVIGIGATGNLIAGNLIGTNAEGITPLGNALDGVLIAVAPGNLIGGTAPGARNVIAGNSLNGVEVSGAGAVGNQIIGNAIGTNAAGTAALGNRQAGVLISGAAGTSIGGTMSGAGNAIAFNDGAGVAVASGRANSILGNAIFANVGQGIDLGADGVTPNDDRDADTGPNDRQNFPILIAAAPSGGVTTIEGTLESTPNTTFRLEFFSSVAADPRGYGEGRTFLGSRMVTTDGTGRASFVYNAPAAVPLGHFVTATVTDLGQNTSEFSRSLIVAAPDRFELNDTRNSPTPLGMAQGLRVEPDLTIHARRNDDWFQFQTLDTGRPGHFVRIDLSNAQGNLDLELYDAVGPNTVAISRGISDREEISLAGRSAGTYYLRVFGADEDVNPGYTLTINAPGSPDADRFEPNNTRETAADLGTVQGTRTESRLTIHAPRNEDWFRFETTAAATAGHAVRIDFVGTLGDLDLDVYDPAGTRLGAVGGGDREEIALAGRPAGTYFVRVLGFGEAISPDYTLTIITPGPDRFEPNNALAAARDLGTVAGSSLYDDLTIIPADPDFYRFTTVALSDASHAIRLTFPIGASGLHLDLYDRAGNPLEAPLVIASGTVTLSLAGRPAETYFLKVSSDTAASRYSLHIDAPAASLVRDWTILVYATVSNLDRYIYADINELEEAAARLPGGVQLVVLYDQSSADGRMQFATGEDPDTPWGDTGRAVIRPDTDPDRITTPFERIGERNTGNPATLTEFVTWAVGVAPARHYALILSDHGAGIRGFNRDDSDRDTDSGDDIVLTSDELAGALAGLAAAGTRFDLVGFDSCLLAMAEVGYQLGPYAQVIVASQEDEAASGFDYTTAFNPLVNNPGASVEAVATGLVRSFQAQYQDRPGFLDTLSATRGAGYDGLAMALRAFTATVAAIPATARNALLNVLREGLDAAADFGTLRRGYRDLGQFLDGIAAAADRLAHSAASWADLRDAARAARRAVDGLIVSKTADRRQVSGLAVYLPRPGRAEEGDYLPTYRTRYADFLTATGWDTVLGLIGGGTPDRGLPPDPENDQFTTPTRLGAVSGYYALTPQAINPGADKDHFQFTLTADGGAGHDVRVSRPPGTRSDDLPPLLRLTLYDASGVREPVFVMQDSTEQTISLSLVDRPAGDYVVLVESNGVAVPVYLLEFNAPTDGNLLDPDPGHNTPAKALNLFAIGQTLLLTGQVLVPGVDDWFAFRTPKPQADAGSTVPPFGTIFVDLQASHAQAAVVLRRGTPGNPGEVVASARGEGRLRLDYAITGGGEDYLIGITPAGNSSALYALNVQGRQEASAVVDDGGLGYSQAGAWTTVNIDPRSSGPTYRYAAKGDGSARASWQFDLPAGAYDVQVSWTALDNRATDAPYRIYQGGKLLKTVRVDQRQVPDGTSLYSASFRSLEVVYLSGGPLRVELSNDADSYVIADAVRVVAVPPPVVDDGQAGYSQTGSWTTTTDSTSVGSTYRSALNGAGTATARWQFDTAPGTYEVQVSWTAAGNRAGDAPYRIYDGAHLIKVVRVDQRQVPSDRVVGGKAFRSLGVVAIGTGPLRVELSNDAGGPVVADAARIIAATAPAVDDGATGYSQAGSWTPAVGFGGAQGDYRYAEAGTGAVTASWQLDSAPGSYEVQVTWTAWINRASDAKYRIFDGDSLIKVVVVDQRQAPSGPTLGGVAFQSLGVVKVVTGSLWVELRNDANSYVIADAARAIATAPPTVIDDGQAGYSQSGPWTPAVGFGGAEGDYRYAGAGDGSAKASWDFGTPAPGAYDVQITWVPLANRASNAPFRIYNGASLIKIVRVDQRRAPSGPVVGGVSFQSLGLVTLTGGSLRVELGNDADSYVIADAVRIAPPTPTPAVVDDGQPGYSEAGAWTPAIGFGGAEGDYRYAAAGDGSAIASWILGAPAPGAYDVQVTWVPLANRASNAPFRIYDGATLIQTVRVNQRLAPSGPVIGGVAFQSLGVVTLTGGPLRVELDNDADHYVIADAVRVVAVAGATASPSASFAAESAETFSFTEAVPTVAALTAVTVDGADGPPWAEVPDGDLALALALAGAGPLRKRRRILPALTS